MSNHVYEHPSASSQRDLRAGQRAQDRLLSPGPWCWPRKTDDPDAYASAEGAVGTPPRALEPGEVLLVTIDAQGSSRGELWAMAMQPEPRAPSKAEFVGAGSDAWLDAQCALPRALPLLWGAVRERDDWLGPIIKLHSERTDALAQLKDRSCGFAFGLALASSVCKVTPPDDVAAIATLDERGALGRVGNIAERLRIVDALALSVTRVVVATSQRDEAQAALDRMGIERLEVVPFSTLSAALDVLLDEPARAIDDAATDERGELVDAFFRLALGESNASLKWGPIERSAERALELWSSQLTPHHRRALEFTRAIAARHHYKHGLLELPSNDWLQWFPLPLRLRVLAHATQQASDTGAPDPSAILALTRESCPELSELLGPTVEGDLSGASIDTSVTDRCCAPHLRLLGAIGRMRYSALGDLNGAILTQLAVCVGWQRCWEYDETTYPLSALFTYVSALALDPGPDSQHAEDLFSQVDALWGESQRGGRRCREDPYVRLARGRALTTLLRYDEASAELDPLVNNLSKQAEQLRLSAARWRLRGANRSSANAAHDALSRSEDPRATLYRALLDLDVALASGDFGAYSDAATRVRREQSGLCDTLLGGAGLTLDDMEAPAFLARRYPY